MSTEEIFTDIYKNNRWTGVDGESRSGSHSELSTTETIRIELPKLCKKLGITSLLDIPCGNFNWLKEVNLDFLSYTGADIVPDVIDHNNNLFLKKNRQFIQLDIIIDDLPKVDLIFCRGLFMHLSLNDIFKTIDNIKKSNSKYLLATSYIPHSGVKENYEITSGQCRPINLLLPPLAFPKPLATIIEKVSTEKTPIKSVLLWKISDLPKMKSKLN